MIPSGREPLTVLFVSNSGELYGAQRSLLDVVERFGPGVRPRFVVPDTGRYWQALMDLGYPVDVVPPPSEVSALWEIRKPDRLVRFALLARRRRADLVHLNLHFTAPSLAVACALARVPLVVHVRNMAGGRSGRTDRYLFGRAAAVICISNAVRDAMLSARLLPENRANRVHLIPDARNLKAFARGNGERVREELGVEAAVPVIGMVARLERMKGQDLFLRMAAQIAKRLPAARFILVGDAMQGSGWDYLRELHALCDDLDIGERVHFLGFRTDIADILAALDCFVHPSRRGAFVSVLIEAMAAGLPIVATDVDGIPECVGRDGAASLIPPEDAAACTEAVFRILTNTEHSRRMKELARIRARRFEVSALSRTTEEVLLSCVRGR
jgi:glycosyltransferase involved in cell wall biosynthesis